MDYKQKGFWIFKIIAESWLNVSYYVAWYDLFRILWHPFDIYVILKFTENVLLVSIQDIH